VRQLSHGSMTDPPGLGEASTSNLFDYPKCARQVIGKASKKAFIGHHNCVRRRYKGSTIRGEGLEMRDRFVGVIPALVLMVSSSHCLTHRSEE
jgi:hypothetical protein